MEKEEIQDFLESLEGRSMTNRNYEYKKQLTHRLTIQIEALLLLIYLSIYKLSIPMCFYKSPQNVIHAGLIPTPRFAKKIYHIFIQPKGNLLFF